MKPLTNQPTSISDDNNITSIYQLTSYSKVIPGTHITDGSLSDNASDNFELRLDDSILTGVACVVFPTLRYVVAV